MDCRPASTCRCCCGTDLTLVLDLGSQPLANSYLRKPAALPTYPLELMVCRDCFHCQLSVVVNPELMFQHYLYVSGTSRTLRQHFATFAQEAVDWLQPRPRDVLDLACNDGTLLEAFQSQGCEVCGVDPAGNLVELARGKGLDVVQGFWPQAGSQVPGPFDLVTAANVLAHVADPHAFLQAALGCLSPHGAVLVEFPYCREMVLNNEWDTIYHEHLSYFLVAPFLRLAQGLGAAVTKVWATPVHGGSLRLALQRGKKLTHCPEVLALRQAELRDGLQELETYRAFAQRANSTCVALQDLVGELADAGRRVVGYGASAKGNTLLNRCPLPLAYIVDDNPLKCGHLTPGCQIPIRSTEALKHEEPELHVLLLAWNFAGEILQNLRAWRPGKGDLAIRYVPGVCCHAVDADQPPVE
jgi:SAM-dependent methyltransferase